MGVDMNQFDQRVLAAVQSIVPAIEIGSDVIPGPPPNFRLSLYVNCWVPTEMIATEANDIINTGRETAAVVARLAALWMQDRDEVKAVTVRLIVQGADCQNVRLYSTAILLNDIRKREFIFDASDVPKYCENEFSSLDGVLALLQATK